MQRVLPCLAAALALLAGDFALAQSSSRGPSSAATGAAPSSGSAQSFGAPSPSGLASPFPPQLPSLSVPGTSAVGTAPPENVPEAPITPGRGIRAAGSPGPSHAAAGANYTVVDIVRAFIMADNDRDGELTRSEAARLTIMPLSFEEMDANHDNRLTRSEYEDSVR